MEITGSYTGSHEYNVDLDYGKLMLHSEYVTIGKKTLKKDYAEVNASGKITFYGTFVDKIDGFVRP